MRRQAIMGTYVLHEQVFPCKSSETACPHIGDRDVDGCANAPVDGRCGRKPFGLWAAGGDKRRFCTGLTGTRRILHSASEPGTDAEPISIGKARRQRVIVVSATHTPHVLRRSSYLEQRLVAADAGALPARGKDVLVRAHGRRHDRDHPSTVLVDTRE
jgi:hypothetical protein